MNMDGSGYFLTNTGSPPLYTRSIGDQSTAAMYFAFTTLSTVGFGDYHPRSNMERLIMAFLMLFGVAVFGYVMGEFGDLL